MRYADVRFALMPALAAGLLVSARAGILHEDLDLSLSADFRSAYVSSSGGIVESRPVTSQCLDGTWRLGDFGRFEGYAWTVSALTGQKDDFRRREFNEVEASVAYAYDWKFTEELSLDSLIGHIWDPCMGYDSYDADAITREIHGVQSFSNPWVTPYYDLLGGYHPSRWMRINTGLRRTFRFFSDTLSVMPFAHVIWGDGARYEAKFERDPDTSICGLTPMYLVFGVRGRYRLCERLSLYLRVEQFDVIDGNGRDYERKRDVSWAHCDLPYAVVGVSVDI